jgi:hypothetical protein
MFPCTPLSWIKTDQAQSAQFCHVLKNQIPRTRLYLYSEMASQDLEQCPGSDPCQIPVLALKQALCFSCWNTSSKLSRCVACKRVSYCSVECQKRDWKRSHKRICKKLTTLNKRKESVPAAKRHWSQYYHEQVYVSAHLLDRRANTDPLFRSQTF